MQWNTTILPVTFFMNINIRKGFEIRKYYYVRNYSTKNDKTYLKE